MRSIMLFRVNNQLFGYETKYIKENVNIDKLFNIPKSPDFIKGMFNLRNNPIPLVDLGLLLWNKPIESDLVIVIEKEETTLGILIEKLEGVIHIDEKKIFDINSLQMLEEVDRSYIEGYCEVKNNIILLLNLNNFLNSKKEINKSMNKSKRSINAQQKIGENTKKDINKESLKGYVIFQVGHEWFSIEVDYVQEILSPPENISPIPNSPNWLKGVFLLREQSVTLIDFAEYLNIIDENKRERVIIVKIKNRLIGFLVSYLKEIKWLDKTDVLSLNLEKEYIPNKGIISFDNGNRLVLILDIINLLNKDIENTLEDDNSLEEKMNEASNKIETVKYLYFSVGSINMAIDIKLVQEVVEFHEINQLPKVPEHILGVINLRNSVIAVISLEKKLNILDSNLQNSEKRIIVLDGNPVSFLVDKLNGILSLKKEDISPPDSSLEIEDKYLEGIAKNSDGSLIFVLNIKNILKKDEKYIKGK